MAITSLDTYIASAKQKLLYVKTATRTSTAGGYYSMFALAGMPAAGTFAVGNTANGLVHTSATVGYPAIQTINNTGYLSSAIGSNTVQGMIQWYDRVFVAGAYTFNDNVVLTAQPSYAARMPGGSYVGTELWIETVTASTGTPSVTITYTNQAGVAGRTTGVFSVGAALILGRMIRIPLQAGDTGIQMIESVQFTVATAGTFNVMVMRPIIITNIVLANVGLTMDLTQTGLPIIYQDTALYPIFNPSTTSTGLPQLYLEVADG